MHRKDRSAQIGLVSTDDGSLRVLKSVDWRGPTHMFFSPDGKYLGFDFQSDVFVLAIDGSREIPAVVYPSDDTMVGWSPDGTRLLLAGVDLSLRILDVQTGRILKQIDNANAYCAAFSPDGKRIVSGGQDKTVSVWDVETGKVLRTYRGHNHWVNSVAYFPDGKRIASASEDGTVRIWRAPR